MYIIYKILVFVINKVATKLIIKADDSVIQKHNNEHNIQLTDTQVVGIINKKWNTKLLYKSIQKLTNNES